MGPSVLGNGSEGRVWVSYGRVAGETSEVACRFSGELVGPACDHKAGSGVGSSEINDALVLG